jgi:hypothetical protein
MKHLLERRESQWIDDLVREITRFDGWKAFVVHFEERSAGDHEGNGIVGDCLVPIHECWLEHLKHLNKVLVVTFETLNASQIVLKPDRRWPDQAEGQAADFRKIECAIVRLHGSLDSSSDLLPIREEKGLSILHEFHDTREFDFARYALRCCHEGAVEVGVGWETKWCEHHIVPEIQQG